MKQIGQDPEVLRAMFEILETQRIVASNARITLVPPKAELLNQLLAAQAPAVPPPVLKA